MPTTITQSPQSLTNNPINRKYVNQFGDGYSQRSRAGINYYIPVWQIKWPLLCTPDECENLWTQLVNTAGVDAVLWESPGDAVAGIGAQKYLVSDLKKDYTARDGRFEISAVFTRVFN